ncbi:ribosomal protein YmL11 precursor, mitochondrial [Drechmeria coniospora]|uniref:Ribosomal protein YmL11, mitochondrial n=1 Tax=Drechmeria coniospora TaxID=98403 RepID=A0A151GFP4_DRECN|nr:ribosomal protein YmL11 precursor, mitochondrial [Drechmeria coniospora]KYK55923.1 ribosomal protein YmL11 precursor, mitochondrial [Drechmeria coniospora]
MVFFQHSNLTAVEWAAVRRELRKAIAVVPLSTSCSNTEPLELCQRVQLQVLRTNMLDVALRIVEFHCPKVMRGLGSTVHPPQGLMIHDLSRAAYDAIRTVDTLPSSAYTQIEPLMTGPVAALVMPVVSPAHLAAALSVLAPVPGKFPPPTRTTTPGYYDPACQSGLAKLVLIGGRIEGKILDQVGVNWVAGINGGLGELYSRLINLLKGTGPSVTRALDYRSQNLWLTLNGRQSQLE